MTVFEVDIPAGLAGLFPTPGQADAAEAARAAREARRAELRAAADDAERLAGILETAAAGLAGIAEIAASLYRASEQSSAGMATEHVDPETLGDIAGLQDMALDTARAAIGARDRCRARHAAKLDEADQLRAQAAAIG